MSEKTNYLECWISVATSLFSQALAGEPELSDSLPKPMAAGSFGFAATIEGDEAGRFAVSLEGSLVDAPLLGEGADQKAGWAELLKEVAESAVGELLAKTGKKCRVTQFTPTESETKLSRAMVLKAGDRSWSIQIHDAVRVSVSPQAATIPEAADRTQASAKQPLPSSSEHPRPERPAREQRGVLSPGLELLLDVELEASLRFGSREMPLGEILDLGPGDVVQLDRHISDPVELIIGDKIVARGEVVLLDGNFGLRVTEVAEPQSRLESIRCLF